MSISQLESLREFLGSAGEGTFSLTLYKKDGMCWSKRGEFPVTKALLESLNKALATTSGLWSNISTD